MADPSLAGKNPKVSNLQRNVTHLHSTRRSPNSPSSAQAQSKLFMNIHLWDRHSLRSRHRIYAPLRIQPPSYLRRTHMADLEQLKQKYAPVLHTLEIEGAQVTNLGLDGEQLALSAVVVS